MGTRAGSGQAAFLAATDPLGKITLDTNAYAYYLKNEPAGHAELTAQLLLRCAKGDLEIEIPGIVELELLVLPYRSRDPGQVTLIRRLTREHPGITTSPISELVLHLAAELRALTPLRAPDALIAASAAIHGSEVLITNDADFAVLNRLANVQLMARGRRPFSLPTVLFMDDFSD